MQVTEEIAFGAFRLDLINECLWRDLRAISLRPKAFAVLKLLIEHPGFLVTKEKVLDTVWPGTFVGDAVLKDNIRQLRDALCDDAAAPEYIETAHRRGYRFIAKISESVSRNPKSLKNRYAEGFATEAAELASSSTVQLLGRDTEMAKMRGWLERALTGERQMVFVTGEPGIGKTTFVEDFLKQTDHTSEILVVRGQCFEHHGSGEAYLPILDGLSRLGRSGRGEKVVESLRQHAPSWLAQMPSLIPAALREKQPHTLEVTRERMLREMADAIEALTLEAPVVLVVEDLHWSDYSTLDLFSYLARRRDPARLMVIGTYRPVDVILGDHPLKGVKRELHAHGFCQELPLECLSEASVATYLRFRFQDQQLRGPVRKAIWRRTEGNPLFVVNLVEHLIDQKFIVEEQGKWNLQVELKELEDGVPSNLKELIERKIERLTPDQRAVLEAASIVGMECSSLAIAAGLDMPAEYVEKHCHELAARHQLLSPAWLAELPDGTVTSRQRFSHILYRQVAYALVPAARRAQIHHRIAEIGVAVYGKHDGEIAAELAMHYEESRDWPCALKYLLQAAENATGSFAHHEATGLAKRGLRVLEFLPDAPERDSQEVRLRLILGVALRANKGFTCAEVAEVYAHGRELFGNQEPSPELFYTLWQLNLQYQFSGAMESSLQISTQLLHLAQALKDGALLMEAHRALGLVLFVTGKFADALQHVNKASELYATHGQHHHSMFIGLNCNVVCESIAARTLWVLGRCDEASERTSRALDLARELGHPQTLMVAGHFAAQLHQLRGEPALAYERAMETVNLADQYGSELWLGFASVELGWAEAELGLVKRGIERMRRGVAAYEATGTKLWSSYYLQLLAAQLEKSGNFEEAVAVVAKALNYAEQSGERFWLAELYSLKNRLALRAA